MSFIYSLSLRISYVTIFSAPKRLFGVPNFRYYALADGIAEVYTSAWGALTDYFTRFCARSFIEN